MEDPLIRIIILALAMLSPVLLALLVMERRRYRTMQAEHHNLQYRWIDRYRSMTDIVTDIVDQNKKFNDRLTRTCALLEVTREENKQVMTLLREIIKK